MVAKMASKQGVWMDISKDALLDQPMEFAQAVGKVSK